MSTKPEKLILPKPPEALEHTETPAHLAPMDMQQAQNSKVIDLKPILPPPMSIEAGALMLAQKKLAEATARIEVLNQEIEDKSRTCTLIRRDLEIINIEAQTAEQKQRNLDFQIQKSRTTLEQLNTHVAHQSAKLEALVKTIEVYEQQVVEKKESCHQQITRLSAELFEDVEKMQALKRQIKETTRAEVEKERDAIRAEVEHFKADAWTRAQSEMDRFDEEMQKKKTEAQEDLRRMIDESKEKGNALLKQAEEIANTLRITAEEKSRVLVEQAQDRLFQAQKQAERELADARRRHDEAEYAFLQEKNSTLARLKNLEKDTRHEAERITTVAQEKAEEELRKAELRAAEIVDHANKRASEIIKDSDRIASEIVDREKNALEMQKKMHNESIDRSRSTALETAKDILDKAKVEAHKTLVNAQEQAKVINQTAQEEFRAKRDEIGEILKEKTREAEKNASEIINRASLEAQSILERSKSRAFNVENIVEEIIRNAQRHADKLIGDANKSLQEINVSIKQSSERLSVLQAEDSRLEFAIKERRKIETLKEQQLRKYEQDSIEKIDKERQKSLIFALVLGLLAGVISGFLTNKIKPSKSSRKDTSVDVGFNFDNRPPVRNIEQLKGGPHYDA